MNTQTQPAVIRCIKIPGYRFDLLTNVKGQPVVRFQKLLTAGRDKGNFKQLEGYYFANEQRREEWITKKIAQLKLIETEKQQKKETKKAIRQNMQHGFEVGQVFYDSWGYNQTNVDFYEIVEVKEKSVIIREIAGELCGSEGLSSMSSMVRPLPGQYTGEPQLKHVIFYLDKDNKPVYHIKSRHGWISLYCKGEKGVYSSWYA